MTDSGKAAVSPHDDLVLLLTPGHREIVERLHGVLRATSIDGTELTYEGQFKDGLMHGKGKMKAALGTFDGEFEQGAFIRGSIWTVAGRTIEADVLKPAYFEVLPDGTRIPVSEADLLAPAN